MKTRTITGSMGSRRRTGMTLVEITLGLALFAGFATSAFLAVETSAGAYGTEAKALRLDGRAREAMDVLSSYLREVDFAALTPPPVFAPTSASSVDFQRSQGFVDGAALWGPIERLAFELDPGEIEDGIDNDGDGAIDEGRVTWSENPGLPGGRRVLLCSGVSAALEGETPGNNLDDNDNGLVDERGFCLEYLGTRMVVHLTLEDRDHDENRILRSASRTLTPRNTPED